MIFDEGYVATQAAGANRIFINGAADEYMATVQAKTSYGEQFAHIYFFNDKSFVMEEARNDFNCSSADQLGIGDLSVSKVFCKGNFQIRKMNDDEQP